jgi:hypothetical protein
MESSGSGHAIHRVVLQRIEWLIRSRDIVNNIMHRRKSHVVDKEHTAAAGFVVARKLRRLRP